jgi:hypothetical protein
MLVCEGYAEDEFVRVIRDLYLERNCGTILQRKNARGNGGARALQLALQLKRETAHDAYGVLIDTDQHWGHDERAQAKVSEIQTIENTPCLEATLLQIDGQDSHRLTRDNKAAFEERYGGPAHREGVIRRNFTQNKFEQARSRVAALEQLLRFIRR